MNVLNKSMREKKNPKNKKRRQSSSPPGTDQNLSQTYLNAAALVAGAPATAQVAQVGVVVVISLAVAQGYRVALPRDQNATATAAVAISTRERVRLGPGIPLKRRQLSTPCVDEPVRYLVCKAEVISQKHVDR